ncbi:MAG: ABC transporter ATP-binding protein [Opitutales bacterium]|nr:ABC transporter ATP-binding protein [Opitutales bacterium]
MSLPAPDEYQRPFVDISRVGKTYPTPRGPAVILKDLDLKIYQGEFIALIGHSGCGKSTLLSMMAGLNSITDGAIIMKGKEIQGPGPDRGVVFQSPCLLPWMTALQNVMLGVNQVYFHASKQDRRAIAEHFLCRVGLKDALHKRPVELSQGMCQRCGIARAFALNPQMLLLDEPFGMLDQLTKFELQEVLLDLWGKDQKTAVMVTHDVDEAIFLADRVVMMTNGPAARIGDVLEIDYPRPRNRQALLSDARYYQYREHLLRFLRDCEREKVDRGDGSGKPKKKRFSFKRKKTEKEEALAS